MIKIICVGKIKKSYFKEAVSDYLKRLSKYTKIDVIEVDDYKTDNASVALAREGELILKHINKKDYIVALDINGKSIDSVEFSNFISDKLITNSNITFIIGGSCGIDNKIKDMCDYKLSFSKMTMPHQLFRVVLLEQIYRAFKIINNESYHK